MVSEYMQRNPSVPYLDAVNAIKGRGGEDTSGQKAMQDVHSKLTSIGMANEDGSYTLETDKSGGIDPATIAELEASGINYNISKPKMLEDKWGPNNVYGVQITLGSHDPKKQQQYQQRKLQATQAGFQQVVNNKTGKMAYINPATGETLDMDTGKITKAKKRKAPTGGSTVETMLKGKAAAKTPVVKTKKETPEILKPGAPFEWLKGMTKKLPSYLKQQATGSGTPGFK